MAMSHDMKCWNIAMRLHRCLSRLSSHRLNMSHHDLDLDSHPLQAGNMMIRGLQQS